MAKYATDASSESDQVSQGLNYRTKLVHDMYLSLPQDMTDVITEMAMDDDLDEKDLMLPEMSKFLRWNHSYRYLIYPAFEFPSYIFKPNWLDSGLVAVQKIDHGKIQDIQQLPAIVRYVILKYTKKTNYFFVNITSTLMERSRDNPLKVYYPYQIWNIQATLTADKYISIRSPEKIYKDKDGKRWKDYWSNPLMERVRRVKDFVRELEKVVDWSERFWIFFDGRIVVTLPKIGMYSENIDTSRLGYEDCERLLRQFQEKPETLNLPPQVRSQLISKASKTNHPSYW